MRGVFFLLAPNTYLLVKPATIIVLGLAALQVSFGEQLVGMDNEMLARAFKGWTVPGYSETKLKSELESSEAPALIQKCMDDERLRKTLPAFPQYVVDDEVREKLIRYILEEPGVWYSDESKEYAIDQVSVMQVGVFVDSALRKEFFLSPDDADLPKLSKAIFRKSTRYLVADLFERTVDMEKSQRRKDSPEMVALVEELRQTLKRFEDGEAGGRSPGSLPRRNSDSGQNPSSTPPTGQTSKAPLADPAVLIEREPRSMLRWVVAVAAIVVAIVAGIVFLRSRAARR